MGGGFDHRRFSAAVGMKKPAWSLLLLTAASIIGGVASFRVDLEAPRYVLRGRSARLVCNHGVERRLLHKVEWLRDGERKLFQFVRGRNPPFRNFSIPGAMLDVAMKALGFEHTTEDIVTLLRPKSYKEMLSFEDFVNIFQFKMSLDPPLHFLMRAFDLYDLEKTRTITTKDIERVSQELGDYLNIEEVSWAQSNEKHITLRKLDLEACGVYSCEVSMETPIYTKPSNDILITVIHPQTSDPEIWGRKSSYLVGERLEVNCSSSPSHPPAHVTWLVNGRQVSDQFLKTYHSHKSHPYHRHHNHHHHHHHRFQTDEEEISEDADVNDEGEDLMLDHDLMEPIAYPSVALVPTSTTVGLNLPIAMHHARLGLGVGGRLRLTCQSTLPSFKGPHPNEVEFSDKRITSVSVDILMPMQEDEDDDEDFRSSSSLFHLEPPLLIVCLPISLFLITSLLLPSGKATQFPLSSGHNGNLCHSQPRR